MHQEDAVLLIGSGTKVEDLNRFIKQYEEMRKVMKDVLNGKNPFAMFGKKRNGFR